MSPVEPLPAATLLLLRDGAAGLEVLMLERHRDAFFSSALVFPGGRLDPADGASGEDASFRVAAIRETYEEAGVLFARGKSGQALLRAGDVAALEGRDFVALVAGGEIALAADLLVPFAHWITPARSPKRYDTRFFLARAPEGQSAAADGHEAVEILWLTPRAALAEADAGRRRLVFATRLNLMRLAASATVAAALAASAASAHKIAPISPEMYDTPSGPRIRIPEGLGYEMCDFAATDTRHG
jgi:8-oxo-dGTP pyrophosphatase MutT (NUDIX family)